MSPVRMTFKALVALILALGFLFGGAFESTAGPTEGRALFASRKCAGCHQIKGPATDRTIKDRLARKGPELWYAGSKFAPGFLARWLANPEPIRPMEYNSLTERNRGAHPGLTPSEAADVAAFLMELKSPAVKPVGIRPTVNRPGKVVFIKKQACYGCHQVTSRGKVVGGLTGPSLVEAGARLNPDWVYAYLSNPDVFKPVKAMPTYAGIIPRNDMAAVASYIATFGR